MHVALTLFAVREPISGSRPVRNSRTPEQCRKQYGGGPYRRDPIVLSVLDDSVVFFRDRTFRLVRPVNGQAIATAQKRAEMRM